MPNFRILTVTHKEEPIILAANNAEEMCGQMRERLNVFMKNTLKEMGMRFPSLFFLYDVDISSECFRDCDSYIFQNEEDVHKLLRPHLNKVQRFLDIKFRLFPRFQKVFNRFGLRDYGGGYHLEYLVCRMPESMSSVA